jgi:hypothetical protein
MMNIRDGLGDFSAHFCARKSFFRPAPPFGVVRTIFESDNISLLLMFLKSVKKLYTFIFGNLLKLRLIIDEKWFSQKGVLDI